MSDYLSMMDSPVVTEKAVALTEKHNRYVIYVAVKAKRPQIKKAIKLLCGEEPLNVCSLRVKGKSKRCKGIKGERKDRKKVYFSLPEGREFKIVGAK
ncbi:50S ribosomal protein L23 [Anaplasma bovis]|uniref:50S ribosomal protein L23 n=1 Tax=Anaplasma bovis TaxID=186733 RepID=UPI002FEFF828